MGFPLCRRLVSPRHGMIALRSLGPACRCKGKRWMLDMGFKISNSCRSASENYRESQESRPSRAVSYFWRQAHVHYALISLISRRRGHGWNLSEFSVFHDFTGDALRRSSSTTVIWQRIGSEALIRCGISSQRGAAKMQNRSQRVWALVSKQQEREELQRTQ